MPPTESIGTGVFGGENGRVSKDEGASKPLVVIEMLSGISKSSVTLGISIVGIGISAALTDARKVSVGPSKLVDTFLRFSLNRVGRGGDGG